MKLFAFVFTVSLGLASARPNIAPRIIGGQAARVGQFPYIAAIIVDTPNAEYFCGGTLISTQHVLTAAHCAANAVEFLVRLGTTRLAPPHDLGHEGVTVATALAVLHPQYNPNTLEHDLAIIQLHLPLTFTQYLHPISLIPDTEIIEGVPAIVTGWGQTNDTIAGVNDQLEYVQVVVITNDECKLTYGDQVQDTMVCSVGNYNEGICTGDTGGPLIYRHADRGSEFLAGVSGFFSQQGCEQIHPSGYQRVLPHIPWIETITNITRV